MKKMDGGGGLCPKGAEVSMVSVKSEFHSRAVDDLVGKLVGEGFGGVFISVSGPYEVIASRLEGLGISTDDIHFIDSISLMAGKLSGEKSDRAVYVENPASLEEISMYVDRMLLNVSSSKRFVFLDSISSLHIYNGDKSVVEFSHFLINKLRLNQDCGVLLSNDSNVPDEIIEEIAGACDSQIKWGGDDPLYKIQKKPVESKEIVEPSATDSFKKNWGTFLNIKT